MSLKIVSIDPLFDEDEVAHQDGGEVAFLSAKSTSPFVLSGNRRLAMVWRDNLWQFLVLATPFLAYGGNLAFSPLLAGVGILRLVVIPPARRWSAGMTILGGLLVWALATQLWSYYQPDLTHLGKARGVQALTGLKLLFELAFYGTAVAAMVALRRDAARRGLSWLAVGLAILVGVLMLEYSTQEKIYLALKEALHQQARQDLAHRNVARAYYVLALLVWPVGVHLWRRGDRWRWLAGFIYGGALVGSVLYRVDAPILGLIAGALAFVAVIRFGRVATFLATICAVAYFVLMPMVVGGGVIQLATGSMSEISKVSWASRIDIWRFVSQLIERRPFFGWGLDASRAFPGLIPLHPHNGALQLWFELGAVGVGLAATFYVWLFSRIEIIRCRDPASAAAATASTVVYLVIGALSFGIWQEWWLGLGALTIIVCVAQRIARTRPIVKTPSMTDLLPLIMTM